MNRHLRSSLLTTALALVAVLSVASAASASVARVIHVNGAGGAAAFDMADGCIHSSAFVGASEDVISTPGVRDTRTTAFVALYRYDACTGALLSSAYGSGPATLDVDPRLATAHVTASVPVFDQSGMSATVTVDLAWNATADAARGTSTSTYRTSAFTSVSHFSGTWRDALAAGTVSDGSTNYATGASLYAQIFSVRSGWISIE
jgi:hypothetical protein